MFSVELLLEKKSVKYLMLYSLLKSLFGNLFMTFKETESFVKASSFAKDLSN